MTERATQASLQDLLVLRAFGELTPEALASLERQLAADPSLAAEAASLEGALARLGDSERAAPPERLWQRLEASARRELDRPMPPTPPPSHVATRHVRRRRSNLRLATAASVALVAGCAAAFLMVDNLQLRRTLAQRERSLELQASASTMLREPNIVLSFPMQASGGTAPASGLVLLDLDARRASIVVRDLPALPAAKSYRLWAQLGSKSVLCGQFAPGADGRILTQFPIPVDSYTAPIDRLILTVEEDAAADAPRGAVVMTSA